MIALAFATLIACLFGALLLWEAPPGGAGALRQAGLGRWLVSGNWPAKVGGGLLLLGVGALIRYALQNVDLPPPLKLGSGLALAAALAAGALALRGRPALRAVQIALAGAALGSAYLTAYAAYGLFAYVTDVQALALLALVAAAGGAFALVSNAMSVAVLAMTGAWLAPAFALGAPGPLQVYGYYLAVALLSAVLIARRGWRALIHLSFLFTLGGALFFGWTRAFYQPVHYPLMQPLLLALVAVHLALPLAERHALRGRWLLQADRLYFALLPLAGALLTLAIAPRADAEGALGLALLSGLWSAAALWLNWRRQPGAASHFAVAALLLAAAALLAFADLPWLLLAMAATVALLWLAPALGGDTDRSELLTLALTALGVAHIVAELIDPGHGPAFRHAGFGERLLGAALLGAGSLAAARCGVAYAAPVGVLGAGWAAVALALELVKLDLADLPLYALALVVAGTLGYAGWLRRRPASTGALLFVLTLLFAASLWAAAAGARSPWLPLAASTLAAAALALGTMASRATAEQVVALALGGVPAIVLPWLLAVGRLPATTVPLLALLLLAAIALAFLLARLTDSPTWRGTLAPLLGGLAGLLLAALTIAHIERSLAGVTAELVALGVLALAALAQAPDERRGALAAPFALAALLGAALIVQAAALRAFGPPRQVLTLADLAAMRLPSVVSLMWAALGAALCVWAGRARRRPVWLAGAALLVVAAVKVVLFDFDDLGQLGNILAVIAAGLVFLAVAWLAPLPPPAEAAPKAAPPARPAPGAGPAAGALPTGTSLPARPARRRDGGG